MHYPNPMKVQLPNLSEIPTYGLPEAAAFLRLPYSVVREWTQVQKLVRVEQKNLLSYFNLLELHVLKGLRRHHSLSMQRIRRGLDKYEELYESAHPLLDPRLETDGFSLILNEDGSYVNLSKSGQLALAAVIAAYLSRLRRRTDKIDFYPFIKNDDMNEPKSVLISPELAFGKPVLAGTGITTEVIAGRFMARDSMQELADEYGVSPMQIEEAIRWELPKLMHAA